MKQPGPFGARWLAEAVRLGDSGARTPAVEDAEQRARAAGGDVEQRILQRARLLAEQDGTLEALSDWRRQLRLGVLIVLALALLGGFSTALAVLGDGDRPVNVIWALGALLGLHGLMLLLWLINMLMADPETGGAIARLWFRFMEKLGGRLYIPRAFATISARAGLTRWWLSALTHAFWFVALSGAWLALVVALALRSYGFGWETTILPPGVFLEFVEIAGWLPSRAGFGTPDAEAVRASALTASAEQVFTQEPAVRRAWSSWLLGALLFYGIVPRAALLLLSGAIIRRRLRQTRLDPASPAWATLAARLQPASEQGGVTDPESEASVSPVLNHAPGAQAPPALLALELAPRHDWPPGVADTVQVMGYADTREQRRAVLERLLEQPVRRLLLVCHAGLSPDRGTLGWIAELSAGAARTGVWLTATDHRPERMQVWRESLLKMGFEEQEILPDEAGALAWLDGDRHER